MYTTIVGFVYVGVVACLAKVYQSAGIAEGLMFTLPVIATGMLLLDLHKCRRLQSNTNTGNLSHKENELSFRISEYAEDDTHYVAANKWHTVDFINASSKKEVIEWVAENSIGVVVIEFS